MFSDLQFANMSTPCPIESEEKEGKTSFDHFQGQSCEFQSPLFGKDFFVLKIILTLSNGINVCSEFLTVIKVI